ncbi:MAG TPA: hypothetical protein VEA16_06290 [Vicinamibacterales bacterium]|nr:hypothetical protein [Vicinamibacterales bacterium]
MARESVADLIQDLRKAQKRMSPKNPDIVLLQKAEWALASLSLQLQQARRTRWRRWLDRRVFRRRTL